MQSILAIFSFAFIVTFTFVSLLLHIAGDNVKNPTAQSSDGHSRCRARIALITRLRRTLSGKKLKFPTKIDDFRLTSLKSLRNDRQNQDPRDQAASSSSTKVKLSKTLLSLLLPPISHLPVSGAESPDFTRNVFALRHAGHDTFLAFEENGYRYHYQYSSFPALAYSITTPDTATPQEEIDPKAHVDIPSPDDRMTTSVEYVPTQSTPLLIDAETGVEAIDNGGGTASWLACCDAHAKRAELFIANQAPDDFENSDEWRVLMQATMGCQSCAQLIMQNIDVRNAYGGAVLISASAYGDSDFVQFLIDAQAYLEANDQVDPAAKEKVYEQALIVAIQNDQTGCAQLLIDAKGSVNSRDTDGETALIWAALNGCSNSMRLLIDSKANLDAQDDRGMTALMWATINADVECVQLLIDANADVNAKNRENGTALTLAAQYDSFECVKLLIAARADLDSRDHDRLTALSWSASRGHIICVYLLVNSKANIEAKDDTGSTALIWAALQGHCTCVKFLVAAKADLHAEDNKGKTALSCAIQQGHRDVQQVLVVGEGIEDRDYGGNTPLLLATKRNKLENVSQLLDKGANIEARNYYGCNALMLAAMNASDLLMDRLISAHASVDKKDREGKTPLMVAAYHSNHVAVKKLLSAKVNVNLVDKCGNTALSLAARHGATSIVKSLLSSKANVKAKDKQSKTALYWALQFGDESCVKVLRSAGSKK